MIDWDGFCDRHLDQIWCDAEDRPKTMIGLRQLCDKLPEDAYEDLPDILILAPAPFKNGQVYSMPPRKEVMIYFSPEMETREQHDVTFTVAHEFAHAVLRHGTMGVSEDIEDAADSLVATWGIPVPARRHESGNNLDGLVPAEIGENRAVLGVTTYELGSNRKIRQ